MICYVGIPHFIAIHFIALCRCVSFLLVEGLWQPMLSKSVGAVFSNSICSLPVCVKHCGNSYNFLNFFMIILTVICDQ